MHTLPLFCPTPCMSSPCSIPPHGCYPSILSTHASPPPILSHSMHALPLCYPSPCTPSPYSIPPHACHPTILSQPMHTLPLLHSTPCMHSLYSIPPNACPQPTPVFYSIPAHAFPPNSLSHTPWRHVSPLTSEYATFESAHTEYIIIIYLA